MLPDLIVTYFFIAGIDQIFRVKMKNLEYYKFEHVSSGRAENIPDFFHKIIEPQFQSIDSIKKIHRSLITYINIDQPIFFLRLYGSFSKDKYDLLRRGFLTEYEDGTRLFFCDNTFSLLFTGLKIGGFHYDERDLKNFLEQQRVKVGFGQTSKEKELCFYTPKNALKTNLNSKGWYQAHIKPTGYGYDDYSLKSEFPNPPRHEWSKKDRIRYVQINLTTKQKKLLQGHFLRLIHPFNSFLVPKRNHLHYSGSNLGEEIELIVYVQKYLKQQFPKEFEEFDQLSFNYDFPNYREKIQVIEWFETSRNSKRSSPDIKKIRSSKIEKSHVDHVDEKDNILSTRLDKWLKSIGKEIFAVILYPELDENFHITYYELAEKYSRYSKFSLSSQKSRLSSAKSIFRNGLEKKALQKILDSSRLENNLKEQVRKYLNKNCN